MIHLYTDIFPSSLVLLCTTFAIVYFRINIMCIKTSKQLSISGWNVNGIFKNSSGAKTCKLENEYFNEIMKSDIVFLSETHTSLSDPLSYDNYKCYINCRSNEPSKKRGGLAVFIKRQISTGITLVDKSMTEIMWFKLNAHFFGLERDLFICFLYISPSNSSFVQKRDLDKQIFSKLEADIAKYSLRGDIMLMGDLNAYINCDEHDFIINDSDNIL